MIVSAILPPWAICPIPKHIRTELERRKNYGIKNVNQMDQIGPRFTWMRCMSNAIVDGRQGFIFRGGDGFENNYGIGGKNQNVMGHDANGGEHVIQNKDAKMKYRPNPGITSLEVSIQKSIYRKCDIKWKCYSVDQLEYMGRYFFGLYNTVVLEWGWNNFNKDSLLPIFEIGNKPELENKKLVESKYGTGIKGVFYDPRVIENSILSSKGNYDAMIGHIVKWDYSFDQSDLSFNCTTEIASNSNIYLGLSLINLTENEAEAADEKSTVNEYFKSKFTAELKESISYKPVQVKATGEESDYSTSGSAVVPRVFNNTGTKTLETGGISVYGRIFWPKKYIETIVRGDITGQPDDIYISFGLLCEILNSKFCVTNNGNQLSKIDINDIVVGGHVNMISTDKDLYLIPNKVAPYFNIADLMNDPSLSRDANAAYAEQPMAAVDTTKINKNVDLTDADAIMKKVLSSAKSRQDLSSIINFESGEIDKRSFPQLTDDTVYNNKAGYYGYLRDVFLNVKTVIDITVGSKDIKSLFDTICERLSTANPFWRLSVQPSAFDGNITIIDENYNNTNQLSALKGHATVGLNRDDKSIYYLDTFNSDSVVTEFKFDVRISDAVASKIINQVNSKMAEGTGGKGFESTENNVEFFTGRTIFTASFDRILDREIKFDKPSKSKFGTAGRNEALYKMVSELDEGCLTIADKNVSLSKKEVDKAVKKIQAAFLAEQKRQLELNLAAQASEDELRRDQYNRSGILNKSYAGDSLVEKAVLSARLFFNSDVEKISPDLAGRILTNPTSEQDKKLLKGVTLVKRNVVRLALPKRHAHLLHRLTADNNDKFVNRNGVPIPQAEIQFSIEGVGGLKSFQVLGIKDLPDPYKNRVIFKIKELKHSITNTGWKTNVIAAIIPVKDAKNI